MNPQRQCTNQRRISPLRVGAAPGSAMHTSMALAARASIGGAAPPANRSQSAAHRQPATGLAAPPAPQSSAASRRTTLLRTIIPGMMAAMAGKTTSAVDRLSQHVDWAAAGAASRQQQHAAQPTGASLAHKGTDVDAALLPRRPAAANFVSSSGPGRARPAAAATSPRVLELQSAAELRHLLACHKRRLLVVHLVGTDCPIGEVSACRSCCSALRATTFLA